MREGTVLSDGTDWTPIGEVPGAPALWPNQTPIVDGVTPVSEVSQDPYLHVDTDDALAMVMGE